MKIINCNIVFAENSTLPMTPYIGNARVISVLDGTLIADENELNKGYSLLALPNTYMDFSVKRNTIFALFDIENINKSKEAFFFSDSSSQIEALAKLVKSVIDTNSDNEQFFKSAAQMLMSLVGDKIDFSSTGNEWVDMAKGYIDEKFCRPIKVEDVAEYVGLDRKYLRNLFSKHLGVSTKEYLMNVRMEKAKELLISEEISVSEIAEAVGYTDPLAFSKIFRTHVGMSPVEFRSGEQYRPKRAKEEVKVQPQKEDIKYFLL